VAMKTPPPPFPIMRALSSIAIGPEANTPKSWPAKLLPPTPLGRP
jgi:hypothetical protein